MCVIHNFLGDIATEISDRKRATEKEIKICVGGMKEKDLIGCVAIVCKNAEYCVQVFDFNQILWCSTVVYMGECIKPKLPENVTFSGGHMKIKRHNQYKATTSQMCIIAQKCNQYIYIYSHCLLSIAFSL